MLLIVLGRNIIQVMIVLIREPATGDQAPEKLCRRLFSAGSRRTLNCRMICLLTMLAIAATDSVAFGTVPFTIAVLGDTQTYATNNGQYMSYLMRKHSGWWTTNSKRVFVL